MTGGRAVTFSCGGGGGRFSEAGTGTGAPFGHHQSWATGSHRHPARFSSERISSGGFRSNRSAGWRPWWRVFSTWNFGSSFARYASATARSSRSDAPQ